MRKINRNNPPEEFVRLVTGSSRPENWDEFVLNYHDLYHQIRGQLLKEQEGMSGYTEKPLSQEGAIHIDHFRKKGMFDGVEFDWLNFIVDEKDNVNYGAGYKDCHIKEEDYAKIIHPVIESPSVYLTYMEDGTIIARRDLTDQAKRDKADFTINIFNLNHPALKKHRCDLICAVRAYVSGSLEKKDVEDALACCGFKSVIDYVYGE